MKNLYRRLQLGLSATPAEIRDAIRSCTDAETARDAEEVLLSPERRSAYDRAFRTLHRIAPIREALDLSRTPHWTPHDRTEFPPRRQTVPPISQRPQKTAQGSPGGCLISFVVVVVAVLGLVIFSQFDTSSPRRSRSDAPRSTSSSADEASRFARSRLSSLGATPSAIAEATERLRRGATLPRPITGILSQQRRGSVPVTVKTSFGSDYFVKFIRGGTTVAEGYIRGGRSLTVDLPAGGYDVRYASGENWFGPDLDFGPDASYARCDRTLQFQNGYEHTIELIRQVNGNLGTRSMRAEDF